MLLPPHALAALARDGPSLALFASNRLLRCLRRVQELTAWPEGLGSGGILERIHLSHNRISALPSAASRVASSEGLRELYIDHNCIASVGGVVVEVSTSPRPAPRLL